jgi:hypothetical protein
MEKIALCQTLPLVLALRATLIPLGLFVVALQMNIQVEPL